MSVFDLVNANKTTQQSPVDRAFLLETLKERTEKAGQTVPTQAVSAPKL